jgi:hypothetical protein
MGVKGRLERRPPQLTPTSLIDDCVFFFITCATFCARVFLYPFAIMHLNFKCAFFAAKPMCAILCACVIQCASEHNWGFLMIFLLIVSP